MQDTPRGNRLHIALFGRRNAGKSSLINALTGQELALVSSVPGTTTDPVFKAMEILPLGPVVLIDTAGIDDAGELGELRIKKTMEVLRKTDLAVLVLDPAEGVGVYELELKRRLTEQGLPVVAVLNKIDLGGGEHLARMEEALGQRILPVSAKTRQGIEELKRELIKVAPSSFEAPHLVGDLVGPGETAILVVPIDSAAPKGRLILPQVQVLRDLLDNDAMGLVVKEGGLKEALDLIPRPKIVITDSQVFAKVAAETPPDVWLTSFSILMARYKGNLVELVKGAKGIKGLKPGDRVLIAEACTHHPQPNDIGRVQIPGWLQRYAGGALDFTWVSGGSFPEDLASYRLVVHCGGCMINRREMLYRLQVARAAGVPMVNYGVLLALAHGTLDRALEPFPAAKKEWEEA
ncbi:MAG: [FeFe] hydrogenase H-cluster maturation GTPase HydF [Thermoanaerobacteraceae bacterium]|uniref:[FeFe] hydrogenase H-cluster maturation GTPase HydF n=1 Tax=Thermanaeromonas sp. C210 TaxID=2731925 RepID=UPI00155C70D3|nr:[FeFe] hydrogenase H-cluster maturation GTPase HydF [Thermanaeromonas sp. C210]MBE3580964.1 [FeFe] hydrogenase H-cluster maturation GTPase HydF [Thermoanaerobacteraceae bacterium]GFN23565.1 [FeFe] hydrogenase H-cluster maturation GTPase HydF [Thermanaeromonas sp. C210]